MHKITQNNQLNTFTGHQYKIMKNMTLKMTFAPSMSVTTKWVAKIMGTAPRSPTPRIERFIFRYNFSKW
jgi:hypothetical protein